MRFGVLMLPTDPWPETVTRAQHLEALGYDHLWTYDHLSWRRYRGRRWFAAMPWLAGIAGVTSRVEIGPMVASPNLRTPVSLAQEAVTVDHISNGRFVLGVGAGGIGFDATVYGHEPLSRKERIARLEEYVDVVARLFAEPVVSYSGTHYTVNEACVQPESIRRPRVPIAIAAGGAKALGLVARFGDAWITLGDTSDPDKPADNLEEVVRTQIRHLEDACAAIERDPATIRRVFLIDSGGERPLASLAAFEDFVGRYAALGFTDLVYHHPRPDDPVWDQPESIVDEIATEILPRWR